MPRLPACPQEAPHALRSKTAEDICASPVVGLGPLERVSTVLQVLRDTTHNGFPVLVSTKGGFSRQGAGVDGGSGPSGGQRGSFEGGSGNGMRDSLEGGGRTGGRLHGFVLRSQVGVRAWHGAANGACLLAAACTSAVLRLWRSCAHDLARVTRLARLTQPPTTNPPQLLVLLRHGAFCDETGRYGCALARQNAAAFEEALAYEMQAAAQSSAYGEPSQGCWGGEPILRHG